MVAPGFYYLPICACSLFHFELDNIKNTPHPLYGRTLTLGTNICFSIFVYFVCFFFFGFFNYFFFFGNGLNRRVSISVLHLRNLILAHSGNEAFFLSSFPPGLCDVIKMCRGVSNHHRFGMITTAFFVCVFICFCFSFKQIQLENALGLVEDTSQ